MKRTNPAAISRWFIAFQAGDPEALKLAVKKYYRRLRALVLLYLPGQISLSKEISLRSFEKAWERRNFFKTLKHFKNFLSVTTKNKCIDYLRKNKKRNRAEAGYTSMNDTVETTPPMDSEKDFSLLMANIYQCLKSIPHWEVVRMAYFENKSTEEIAAFLNTSTANVYTLKTRAINALRTVMLPGRHGPFN